MSRVRTAGACFLLLAAAACGGPDRGPFGGLGQAATVCPTGTVVAGIDVSAYQETIDWGAVAADTTNNIQFAYAKATEGGNTIGAAEDDPYFPSNWPAMKAAGLIRGAYHFFHSSDDGTAQADNFLAEVKAAGGFAAGDLPPVLDWESTDTGSSSMQAVANAQAFVAEILAQTGMQTVIYTDFGYFDGVSGTGPFASDSLWAAAWSCTSDCSGLPTAGTCPGIETPWSGWLFWQWSDDGAVSGVSGADLDLFNGSLAQLQQYAASMSGSPFSPPAQVSGNDALTLVTWTDKHQELFARSPSGTELHTWTTGTNDTWEAPASLDTGAECGSAAAFWGPPWSYPELFSPLTDGSSGHLSWSVANGWTDYTAFAGNETDLSHFATTVGNDGRAWLFALGSDGAIRVQSWDATSGSWSGWTSLGGAFVTGVGPITWGNGTIEIFATDVSGTVWHTYLETSATSWPAWATMGGGMASRPIPIRWNDGEAGHAEIFVRGADSQLYEQEFSYTDGWPGAFTLLSAGTTIAGEPSALMSPDGGPEVFARNGAGNVLSLAWNGSGYTPLEALGDQVVASDPFGWTRGDGAAEVFAIDDNGVLVHDYDDPTNGWTGWGTIGSGFDACNGTSSGADGGTTPDAGESSDAGVAIDAGESPDAGAVFTAPDGGGRATSVAGCGCAAGSGGANALLGIVLVGALGRRKRRVDQWWRRTPGV